MSSVTIVLLCEDKQTESFVCNFLKHRNFKKGRDITTLVASSGSGEQWVREQHPKQLNAIRNRKNAYLIVVIDADTYTIDDRHEQLKKSAKTRIFYREIIREMSTCFTLFPAGILKPGLHILITRTSMSLRLILD